MPLIFDSATPISKNLSGYFALKSSNNLNILGVLLTGMGQDGAEGISHIKQIGGITIVEDKKSSVVFSMPKSAIATGKVDYVYTPEQIKDFFVEEIRLLKRIVGFQK